MGSVQLMFEQKIISNYIVYGKEAKNSIFVSLLKQYKNIDVGFINTFFKKFKIGGELNFDIEDKNASKYLGISLITTRKRLSNAYSKTNKLIENVDYIKIKTKKHPL